MITETEIVVKPEETLEQNDLKIKAANALSQKISEINQVEILKKSIDARKGTVVYRLKVRVYSQTDKFEPIEQKSDYKNVKSSPAVIIIGAGPAGLFAALRALEVGLKPIVLERGKDVTQRKRDNAEIVRTRNINPESNWCFGEGGAGTFSDGKLYTRSNKRGNVQDILQKFIEHGANPNIKIEAHAHIGTDKLPTIIAQIRNTILEHGGEVHFDTKIVDFKTKGNSIVAAIDQNGTAFEAKYFLLATGHSARDMYELFHAKQWVLEAKPLAMGVRVEHPQELINQIQYHSKNYSQELPPASYQLVAQVGGRGVFSFCMCPGGIIVPAATAANQIVVNGMSNSLRNSPYANAGIAVAVDKKDIPQKYTAFGELALLRFQQDLEEQLFVAGGNDLSAPAQRLTDFVQSRNSPRLNPSSYMLSSTPAPLHKLLPDFMAKSLQNAFKEFDKKMRGFYTEQANILALESRTSSPVRIPRNDHYQYLMFENLYPCGEGAGYAGGIVSSAMDGCNAISAIGLKSL